ncbi:MAG: biotin/lipoyl-binding protein [Candidatus Aminicenantes bacterium]
MTMTDTQLPIMSELSEDQQRILAPAAGYYSERPQTGAFLIGGSFVGKLKILNQYYDLHLPQDVYGQVWAEEKTDLVIPVEYGQELFRLNPERSLFDKRITVTEVESKIKEVEAGIPAEGFVVTAFTNGIFYAKPSPDAPPFVSLGQEIEKGKALGLIEVMKTFNHIIFHGTEDSETGKITKIYVKDSQEVKQGDPLFLIEEI